jgi:hypothetical protein
MEEVKTCHGKNQDLWVNLLEHPRSRDIPVNP